MFRPRIASAAAIILGGVAFLLFFSAYLRSPLTIPLRTDQRIVRQGFYSVERNKDHIFAWTGPHAEFTVPAVDRSIDWRVTIEIKVWRPRGVPLPNVRIGVDGVTVTEQMLKGDVALAATAVRRTDASGITVSIDTTPAFEPGPRDKRKLGVAIASMTLEPIGGAPRVPLRAAANGVAAIVIVATAVAALGVPSLWVAAFAIFVAWGEAALLTRGVGPYAQYPSQVLVLATALGSGLLAAVWSVEKLRRQKLSAAAIGVVAICLMACYLKLLMLLHPDMPIGDGVFHAHRFEYVLAGRLYFTSLTPDCTSRRSRPTTTPSPTRSFCIS